MSAIHPNDQLHFFERALAALEKVGEASYVIRYGQEMRDELVRIIRGQSSGGLNLPRANTGD